VSKDERSKLDSKTRECIFIGHDHDESDYRFYDPVEKKFVRSRDVIFVEDHTVEDIGKTEKSESLSTNDVVDFDQERYAWCNKFWKSWWWCLGSYYKWFYWW